MSVEMICEWGIPRDLPTALAQAEATRRIGADFAKWQLVRPEKLASPTAGRYWDEKLGANGVSQRDLFAQAGGIEDGDWRTLADACRHLGVGFACSPFDLDGVDLLCGAGVDALKIASGDLTYRALIEKVAGSGKRIIVSTGAAHAGEIMATSRWLGRSDVTWLACDLVYPCPPEQANFAQRIRGLRSLVGDRVGYSDHTHGTVTGAVAVALGARVLEKHVTLEPDGDSPDDKFALHVGQAAEYLAAAKLAATLTAEAPGDPEAAARVGARRSAHAARKLPAGHKLTARDVAFLRPAPKGSFAPTVLLAGRTLVRPLSEGEMITHDALAA